MSLSFNCELFARLYLHNLILKRIRKAGFLDGFLAFLCKAQGHVFYWDHFV